MEQLIENSKYKEIFTSKVSYGFRFFYYPFILTAIVFIIFMFTLFYALADSSKSTNLSILGLSVVLFFVELVLLRVLGLYITVRLFNYEKSFIVQISEANKVLFVKEFDKIEYWWNYQSIDKGEVLTQEAEDKTAENQNNQKRFQFLFSFGKKDKSGKSLPRTLFVKLLFHDEEVILYETLGYYDDIPHNFPYSVQINSVHAESYKLGKFVEHIEAISH